MPVNLLSDVDVIAISVVKQGANRKRIYLRKSKGDEFTLPASHHRIIKAGGDWSVFYTVVAEPGARESPGVGSPEETNEDVWASPDEIRKAAHKFMKNGALVNRMHESLAPYGTVVENFVAQADFKVGDELIKEGSWVVGIEPSEEGRRLIESGEFTGVSIQGVGVRTLAKKAGYEGDGKTCPKCKANVKGDASRCPSCGFEFVSKSAEDGSDAIVASEMALEQEDRSLLQKIAASLGIKSHAQEHHNDQEDDVPLTDEQVAQLAKVDALEGQLTDLTKDEGRLARIESQLESISTKLNQQVEEKPEEKQQELEATVAKLTADLEKAQSDLEALAEGGSNQDRRNNDSNIKKADPDDALAFALFG